MFAGIAKFFEDLLEIKRQALEVERAKLEIMRASLGGKAPVDHQLAGTPDSPPPADQVFTAVEGSNNTTFPTADTDTPPPANSQCASSASLVTSDGWDPCDPNNLQQSYRDKDKNEAIMAAIAAHGVTVAASWSMVKKHKALLEHVAGGGQPQQQSQPQPQTANTQQQPQTANTQQQPQTANTQQAQSDPFAAPQQQAQSDPFGGQAQAKVYTIEETLEIGKRVIGKLGNEKGFQFVNFVIENDLGQAQGTTVSDMDDTNRSRLAVILLKELGEAA